MIDKFKKRFFLTSFFVLSALASAQGHQQEPQQSEEAAPACPTPPGKLIKHVLGNIEGEGTLELLVYDQGGGKIGAVAQVSWADPEKLFKTKDVDPKNKSALPGPIPKGLDSACLSSGKTSGTLSKDGKIKISLEGPSGYSLDLGYNNKLPTELSDQFTLQGGVRFNLKGYKPEEFLSLD